MDTDNDQKKPVQRIAVVGGGITGIAAAHRLQELDPSLDVTLFEASNQLGGVIQTEQQGEFCIELGPDSFVTQVPWGLDFCRRIGFEEELIATNKTHRTAYVVSRGRMHPLPPGVMLMAPSRMWPLILSPLFSLRGKLRMCCEFFVPRRTEDSDESLADFARRRLGPEVFDRLVQPLSSGIYMADPERLSMRAGFPQFVEMEKKYGSLIWAAKSAMRLRRKRIEDSGPRYSLFVAPRRGLSSLIDAAAAKLPSGTTQLNCSVEKLQAEPDGSWRLSFRRGSGPNLEHAAFDGVILAAPPATMGQLLSETDEPLGTAFEQVSSSGCVIVTMAFTKDQIRHPLDGFGFVVPLCEGRDVVACTFSSVKYDGRAPADRVLLRAFLGGACRPEAFEWDDAKAQIIVLREIDELIGIQGNPLFTRIQRWPDTMPQYEVGHLDRVQFIESRLAALNHLEVAGNAFRGVGIPYCIHTGELAAERVVKSLGA